MILCVGDIHGDFKSLFELEEKYKDICRYVIQVGDLSFYKNFPSAHADGKFLKHLPPTGYPVITDNPDFQKLPIKTFFIKGNHDDYDNPNGFEEYNIFYLKTGIRILDGRVIATLGGIYSPKKYPENPKYLKGRSRRFFTNREVRYLKSLARYCQPYVLLTHQAGTLALPENKKHEGIPTLDKLLLAIKPELYIYGHHHINYTSNIPDSNIQVFGLGALNYNKNSYMVI